MSPDEVVATNARLTGEGLPTATEDNVTCCYAVQDKVWVDDPTERPGRSTPSSLTATRPTVSCATSNRRAAPAACVTSPDAESAAPAADREGPHPPAGPQLRRLAPRRLPSGAWTHPLTEEQRADIVAAVRSTPPG